MRPSKEELEALIARLGSNVKAAAELGVSEWTIRNWRKRPDAPTQKPTRERVSCTVTDDQIVAVLPASEKVNLGDIDPFLREHGLDPADWIIVSTTLNKWNAMTGAQRNNEIVWMRQMKVTLRPAPRIIFDIAADHTPPVKLPPRRPVSSVRPALYVIEGDHQIPYHDPDLHIASLYALEDLFRQHNMRRHVFLGDTGDYPTISRHPDHPVAMAAVKRVNQGVYDVLRQKREAAPVEDADKLEGNHDWRVKSELLLRAERMYDIAPVQEWEQTEPELPSLHLSRTLKLDKLGIRLVEDRRGWQHAEVDLIPGPTGLGVRHGWLTGANTALKTLEKLGRPAVVGHIHQRDYVSKWNPTIKAEQQLFVAGTMSLVRGGISVDGDPFPHFAPEDNWTQGFVIVSHWPDGKWIGEHAIWDGRELLWRDKRWSA